MTLDVNDLAKEFPRSAVHWRVQGSPYKGRTGWAAMALAYIDARDVMDRLDEVCGPSAWQDSYTETASGRVICTLSILIDGEWVSKSDGAGGTQVEAEKGGLSDALKRAAVKWGIGRYLYRLDSPWVACDVKERGDKVYWRRWTEDPWGKVKKSSYVQAADTEKSEMDWFTENVPEMKDADAINMVLGRAKRAGPDASRLVMERAKALQLEYDEAQRKYVYLEQAA